MNLRDLPIDLVRRAKAYAALRGMTLKDFVIQAITVALERDIPAVPGSATALTTDKRSRRRKYKCKSPDLSVN